MTISKSSLAHVLEKTRHGDSANVPGTLVARDSNGDFSAGVITATFAGSMSGNADTATALAAGGADRIKLDSIATGATANSTDAQLRDRATHTGAQAISTITGLQTALDAKAPLASPALTGTPTAPTATAGTNTTQIATTAYVRSAITSLVDTAPTTLDTLNELAAALGDDPNFATTISNSLATKAPLASPTFTGTAAFANLTVSGTTSGVIPARLGAVAKSIADWNSATENGWYMGESATNAPTATGWYMGHVESHGGLGWLTQLVHGFSGDSETDTKTWRREQNNGSWGSWQRLRLTQAEQSAIYLDAANLNTGTVPSARLSGTYAIAISGNASTATTLATARTINGTSFNGGANITTASWGTARTLTIGGTGKSVNGSADVAWSLAEIGALPLTGGTLTGTLTVQPTTGTGQLASFVSDATSNSAYIRVAEGIGAEDAVLGSTSGVGFVGTQSNTAFALRTNNTDRVSIGTDGLLDTSHRMVSSAGTAGADFGNAGLELREVGRVATGQTTYTYAPSLGFHWGGTQAATLALHSDGNLYLRANGYTGTEYRSLNASAFNVVSDIRLKGDIADLSGAEALGRLHRVNARRYRWLADGRPDLGFIAQELAEACPEAVSTDSEGLMTVDYARVAPSLWAICRAQQDLIDTLNTRLAAVEARVA